MDLFGLCCLRKQPVRGEGAEHPSQHDPQRVRGFERPKGRSKHEVGGVGITFHAGSTKDGLVVASVDADGPAHKCGLVQAGDVLIKIDDVDVRGITTEDLALYILGPPGSKVMMGFARHQEGDFTVELFRGEAIHRRRPRAGGNSPAGESSRDRSS